MMTKESVQTIFNVSLSLLIIGLFIFSLITGTDLSFQVGLVLLGGQIILNIVLYQSKSKIAKILYIWCAVLLMLIGARLYLIDCAQPYLDRATDITYEIRTSLKNANGSFADMVIATGEYGWDRLYLLPPHTDVNEFLKENHLSWYGDKKEDLKYQDDTALLIFTLGNKVSCYAEIKREDSTTDFSEVVRVHNVTNSFYSK